MVVLENIQARAEALEAEKSEVEREFKRKYGVDKKSFDEKVRVRRPPSYAKTCLARECPKKQDFCVKQAIGCFKSVTRGTPTAYHVAALVSSVKRFAPERVIDEIVSMEEKRELKESIPLSPDEFNRWRREPGARRYS